MTDPSSLRVADADREQLAGELREHLVAGRRPEPDLEAVEARLRARRARSVAPERRHAHHPRGLSR